MNRSAHVQFSPVSKCALIGVESALEELQADDLVIIGDSTTIQTWSAIATVVASSGGRSEWPPACCGFASQRR